MKVELKDKNRISVYDKGNVIIKIIKRKSGSFFVSYSNKIKVNLKL